MFSKPIFFKFMLAVLPAYIGLFLPPLTYANNNILNVGQDSITTLFNGTIEGQQSVGLRTMQAGRIISLALFNGSMVNKGDIIAEVYSPEWADNWHQAKANYNQINVALTHAEKAWQRAKALHQKQLISLANVDEAETHFFATKASLAVAQAKVNSNNKRYQERLIRAPFSGLISQLYVRQGDYINSGQRLLVLNEINRQKAKFYLPERYAIALSLGQALTLTIPTVNTQQEVTITEIARPQQGGSRLFEITVVLSETQHEFIGLQAQLSIESTPTVYRVSQSLLNYNLSEQAYIFTDDKQKKISVTVDAIKNNYALVRAVSTKVDLLTCCLSAITTLTPANSNDTNNLGGID
jgi:RND family efflux transporter MFP subunit